MLKIKNKIDEYLGFDSSNLFGENIRLFGGAIRDTLADQPIQDLDILLGPKSITRVRLVLESNGYEYMENYSSKDVIEMYKDIHIINEPATFMKVVNNKISMVQLIRPSRVSDSSVNGIKESILNIIWNVDLSVCGVSWDGQNLYENIPSAISECRCLVFKSLPSSLMYNSNRSFMREKKLIQRGWVKNDSLVAYRRVRLESIIPDENISFIKEYLAKNHQNNLENVA